MSALAWVFAACVPAAGFVGFCTGYLYHRDISDAR